MRSTVTVKPARHLCAQLLYGMGILVACGPLGCELLGASVPAPPKAPEIPEAPEAPAIEAPKPPEAPAIKAPEAPKVDTPDPEGGACCLRGGEQVGKSCGAGAKACCTQKLDRAACEANGGLWYHTVQGCAGSC